LQELCRLDRWKVVEGRYSVEPATKAAVPAKNLAASTGRSALSSDSQSRRKRLLLLTILIEYNIPGITYNQTSDLNVMIRRSEHGKCRAIKVTGDAPDILVLISQIRLHFPNGGTERIRHIIHTLLTAEAQPDYEQRAGRGPGPDICGMIQCELTRMASW
jgi:hypothetical protein